MSWHEKGIGSLHCETLEQIHSPLPNTTTEAHSAVDLTVASFRLHGKQLFGLMYAGIHESTVL